MHICLSPVILFVLENSVDPDEMLHHAAFHRGLHCLPFYRVPTGQGKVREICFFFKVREKSRNSVKWSGKLENP